MIESRSYWRKRYTKGGNSGDGSYGKLAEFKAEVINEFIKHRGIKTVLDMGCGDGNQARLLRGFEGYTGVDISKTVLRRCRLKFRDRQDMKFIEMGDLNELGLYDMAISLDVIYHLLEDSVYEDYMKKLFGHAGRYVIIYSSDTNEQLANQGSHLRQRKFSDWVQAKEHEWELIGKIENEYPYNERTGKGSISDFYIYGRK